MKKGLIMSMEHPTHPGVSIREGCLGASLTVTEAAGILGVARHTLSRVLNGHAGISPEMAIRLEKVGWSNAEFWMRRQAAYDLAQARLHADQITVGTPEPLVPATT
jgi:addiction module HigA family antidote